MAHSALLFNPYGKKSLAEVAFGPDPTQEDVEAVVQYLSSHSHPSIYIADLWSGEAEDPIYWGEIKLGGVSPDGRRVIDSFSISRQLTNAHRDSFNPKSPMAPHNLLLSALVVVFYLQQISEAIRLVFTPEPTAGATDSNMLDLSTSQSFFGGHIIVSFGSQGEIGDVDSIESLVLHHSMSSAIPDLFRETLVPKDSEYLMDIVAGRWGHERLRRPRVARSTDTSHRFGAVYVHDLIKTIHKTHPSTHAPASPQDIDTSDQLATTATELGGEDGPKEGSQPEAADWGSTFTSTSADETQLNMERVSQDQIRVIGELTMALYFLDQSTVPRQWAEIMAAATPAPPMTEIVHRAIRALGGPGPARDFALQQLLTFVQSSVPAATLPNLESKAYNMLLFAHQQKAVSWEGGEGVQRDRRFAWCSLLGRRPTEELVTTCPKCGIYLLVCCEHLARQSPKPCHHYQILYFDGACSNNGESGATAGIGVAFGKDESCCFSYYLEITEHGQIPTSQRAELSAAILAVSLVDGLGEACGIEKKENRRKKEFAIVGDSEYVIKGITEWYPNWKRKGWKTSSGNTPSNLDLFHQLNKLISEQEAKGIKIGFWHVERRFNSIADKLAKEGKSSRETWVV
ncbi:hypothetical protein RQP46_005836 [Phenoliferia psychrophenolica]